MQTTMRIARRCTALLPARTLLLPRALPLVQTDGLHSTVLYAYRIYGPHNKCFVD